MAEFNNGPLRPIRTRADNAAPPPGKEQSDTGVRVVLLNSIGGPASVEHQCRFRHQGGGQKGDRAYQTFHLAKPAKLDPRQNSRLKGCVLNDVSLPKPLVGMNGVGGRPIIAANGRASAA